MTCRLNVSLEISKQPIQQVHYISKISLASSKPINIIHSNFYTTSNKSDSLTTKRTLSETQTANKTRYPYSGSAQSTSPF